MSDDLVRLSVLLGDWLLLDGQMDNTHEHNAYDLHGEEDHDLAERAKSIRESGWVATRPILDPLVSAGEWPPSDEVCSCRVEVSLMTSDWQLAIREMRESTAEHGGHEVADRIEAALRAQT